MRLPNSYGSVYKLKGQRRNPWVARKTIGYHFTEKGMHPKYMYIGYYRTKADALQSLAEYNGNPYGKEVQHVAFYEVYNQFAKEHFPKLKESSTATYRQMYAKLSDLHSMPMRDIKLYDIQKCISKIPTHQQQEKAKWVCKAVFDYAIKHEIIPPSRKDLVASVDVIKEEKKDKEKKPFTEEMIHALWDDLYFDGKIVLILLYTGVRIMELLDLKCENVHLKERYFDIVESKTKAGIRSVPICDKIYPFIEEFYGDEYLIHSPRADHFTYQTYIKTYWHYQGFTPHCCRYTFISQCVQKGIDQRIIKKIVGHSGDMTENIYTRLSMETLLDAVNKL